MDVMICRVGDACSCLKLVGPTPCPRSLAVAQGGRQHSAVLKGSCRVFLCQTNVASWQDMMHEMKLIWLKRAC
jgi:hypothetical protein